MRKWLSISPRPRIAAAILLTLAWSLWLLAQAPVRLGFAILTQSGNTPILASALFSVRNADGVLVSEAGAAASQPIGRGRIFVDQRGVQTGVALVNPSSQETEATLVLRDDQGIEVGRLTRSIAPMASLVDNVSALFGELGQGFTGSLTFETTSGVAAVTLRQRDNSFGETLLATFPVADLTVPTPDGSELLFPQIGAGSILSTEIILVERDGRASTGSITFVDSQGSPLELQLDGVAGSTFPYALAPNGTFAVTLTSPSGIRQGYAVVTPAQGSPTPFGTAVFRYTAGASPISEAGVAAARSTRHARLFVDNSGTQTGIAVANPNGGPLELSLTLRDRNGLPIATESTNVPAGGHSAAFVDQFFDLPAGFTGLMDIEAPQPFDAVTLKLTGNSRGDPILTTLPLATLDSPPPPGTLVFPRVGFGAFPGGQFATRLIVLNLDDVGSFSGTLSFLESAGGPLETPLSGETGSQFSQQIPAGGGRQLRPGDEATAAGLVFDLNTPNVIELAINLGESRVVRPAVIDTSNEVRDDFEFSFASVSPEVASIDSLGRIEGREIGFTSLTVSTRGLIQTLTVAVSSVSPKLPGYSVDGVVMDRSQRVYLASRRDQAIWRAERIDTPPELWAGVDATSGYVDAPRLQALFDRPSFLALNIAAGLLYASDTDNNVIRVVENRSGGVVRTLAGTGQADYLDGPALEARFSAPGGVALDPAGNLWVADTGNHVIRRVRLADGTVDTVAGVAGQPGLADGDGADARFNAPLGIALEQESLASQVNRQLSGVPPPPISVIVADSGNGALRRVFADGRVETLAVGTLSATFLERSQRAIATPFPGVSSVAADPLGDVFLTQPELGTVSLLRRDGIVVPVTTGDTFTSPRGLAVVGNGRVLVTDVDSTAREVVYGPPEIDQVTPSSVSNRGGVQVTVTGRNFAPESIVIIANRTVTDVFRNTTELSFTVPPLASGLTTLTVQHRGGLAQTAFFVETTRLADLDPGQITTLGGGATFLGDGGPALLSEVPDPNGIAIDTSGNIFLVETLEHRVRRIDRSTGVITTVAGNGTFGFSGDGGPAVAASLCVPEAVAIDARGNLLITDAGNQRIRQVDLSSGTIDTLAGSAPIFSDCANSPAFAGDGGPALEARFNSPRGIALDASGDIYVVDGNNRRIRRIDAVDQTIDTIAGTGEFGFTGDGGPALDATFASPYGMAITPDLRSLLVADRSNHAIRSINLNDATIDTIAGTGSAAFDGDGGPATQASLNNPRGVATDDSGTVLIADTGNHRIRRISNGTISTIAGSGAPGFGGDGGPALESELNSPLGVASDNAGNVLVADTDNARLRQVNVDGSIQSLAGTNADDFSDEGLPAAAARLMNPIGLALDNEGNLFVVDADNYRVVRFDNLDGAVHTIAGNGLEEYSGDGGPALEAGLFRPRGIAVGADGAVFVTDTNNIRRIDPETGIISRFAGMDVGGFSGEGAPPLEATFRSPDGLVFDSQGNLYIADTMNQRVRVIEAETGLVRTVAGNGDQDFSGDGGPATEASLSGPVKLAVDSDDRVYVSDLDNQRIRRIDPSTGTIETVAGSSEGGFAGDGGPATEAALGRPRGIAVGSDGTLWIADTGIRRVREVDPQGVIHTIAGDGRFASDGDNGPATEAGIGSPWAMVLDSNGNLIFTDAAHYRVRAIRAAGSP